MCPIGPKVWDIVEIRLHRASVFRAIEYRVRHYFNRYWIDQNLILSIFWDWLDFMVPNKLFEIPLLTASIFLQIYLSLIKKIEIWSLSMLYIAYSDKCVHYEIWKAPASCWSLSKGQLLWDITLCLVVVVFLLLACADWYDWCIKKLVLKEMTAQYRGASR